MINVVLVGSNGTMGREVSTEIESNKTFHLVAGVEKLGKQQPVTSYPTFECISQVPNIADVVIDFSHPSLLPSILTYGTTTKTPLVLCTTGYTEQETILIGEAAKHVAVFHSANMSMGVNLLMELITMSASFLGREFDIEIVEKHHNQKIDAPSGTALLLAEEINRSQKGRFSYNFDRSQSQTKRSEDEIGIHAVRGGSIVGEHEVIFAGQDEIISISHSAFSKKIFVNGALKAAAFVVGKEKGLYTMKELLHK